ncbi:MAG TPA: 6-phosphogluconolactonase [Phycisphaerales bacterium]|nr:6-phosphogluconolactonase [Phycisphaerales bacterium]
MADLYELAPVPVAPNLPGTVVLRDSPDTVVDAIAADLVVQAQACVRAFGDFHLALSGGSTPVPLYMRLMYDPAYRGLPWARTHLWLVDERRVGFDDERSNFKMINEIIGTHSGIPEDQVHPIFALSDDADTEYQARLQEVLGWREKGQDRLDFVILGMGGDGHTASLFPGSPALDEDPERPRLVTINSGPGVVPPDRVTMTFRMINASRFVGIIVTGPSKRQAVARVEARAGTVRELPVLGVRPPPPPAGELRWYLDHAACPQQPPPLADGNGAR